MQSTDINKNVKRNYILQPNEEKLEINNEAFQRFGIRTAPKRLLDGSNQPMHEQLVGDLIESGKITIVFSDTGVGKSIFVTQIADELSKGKKTILGQPSIGKPLNILMFDNELTDSEFKDRHQNARLRNNFYISNKLNLKKSGELDLELLIAAINLVSAQVVIIDNITAASLESLTDTEAGMKIMRAILEVKKMLGVAFIIVAHVPKTQAYSELTINQLGGSKMISNFSDSVIGLARSTSSINHRYIKHIKNRSKKETDKVILLELKGEEGNLHFKEIGNTEEWKAIDKKMNSAKEIRFEKAIELKSQGLSYEAISKETGIAVSTLHRNIKDL